MQELSALDAQSAEVAAELLAVNAQLTELAAERVSSPRPRAQARAGPTGGLEAPSKSSLMAMGERSVGGGGSMQQLLSMYMQEDGREDGWEGEEAPRSQIPCQPVQSVGGGAGRQGMSVQGLVAQYPLSQRSVPGGDSSSSHADASCGGSYFTAASTGAHSASVSASRSSSSGGAGSSSVSRILLGSHPLSVLAAEDSEALLARAAPGFTPFTAPAGGPINGGQRALEPHTEDSLEEWPSAADLAGWSHGPGQAHQPARPAQAPASKPTITVPQALLHGGGPVEVILKEDSIGFAFPTGHMDVDLTRGPRRGPPSMAGALDSMLMEAEEACAAAEAAVAHSSAIPDEWSPRSRARRALQSGPARQTLSDAEVGPVMVGSLEGTSSRSGPVRQPSRPAGGSHSGPSILDDCDVRALHTSAIRRRTAATAGRPSQTPPGGLSMWRVNNDTVQRSQPQPVRSGVGAAAGQVRAMHGSVSEQSTPTRHRGPAGAGAAAPNSVAGFGRLPADPRQARGF